MQIGKWGNSLAVRLPAAVVEALQLKDGDEISVEAAGGWQDPGCPRPYEGGGHRKPALLRPAHAARLALFP